MVWHTVKDNKLKAQAAQSLVGGGLGGILPTNLNYRQPEVDPDPEVGTHPAAKPLNQGVGPLVY